MSYDWTRFKKHVFIDADVAAVFDAWAIPAQIVQWFIAEADVTTAAGRPRDENERLAAGDRYRWRWHQDLAAGGLVCHVEPGERLVFTFGKQAPDSDVDVIVTVDVAAAADGRTRLTLTQENMADTPDGRHYHLSCNLGWSFFMTNLKGWLEHGVDLREAEPELAEAARAISAA